MGWSCYPNFKCAEVDSLPLVTCAPSRSREEPARAGVGQSLERGGRDYTGNPISRLGWALSLKCWQTKWDFKQENVFDLMYTLERSFHWLQAGMEVEDLKMMKKPATSQAEVEELKEWNWEWRRETSDNNIGCVEWATWIPDPVCGVQRGRRSGKNLFWLGGSGGFTEPVLPFTTFLVYYTGALTGLFF